MADLPKPRRQMTHREFALTFNLDLPNVTAIRRTYHATWQVEFADGHVSKKLVVPRDDSPDDADPTIEELVAAGLEY